ncbi:hypothetical protein [uncultured Rikenella sp.]|uniref:hypothetical protein n=1 Tax=uncultured Rikenella sp. TaxID=368003 RepID=UPI002619B5BA|nr:hypothetical protein [uncultured Rikenella sp.]
MRLFFSSVFRGRERWPESEANVHNILFILPAPGFRTIDDGALWYVNNSGYSWAATASDIHGMYLSFHAKALHPSNSTHRASGLQLRCLSE